MFLIIFHFFFLSCTSFSTEQQDTWRLTQAGLIMKRKKKNKGDGEVWTLVNHHPYPHETY